MPGELLSYKSQYSLLMVKTRTMRKSSRANVTADRTRNKTLSETSSCMYVLVSDGLSYSYTLKYYFDNTATNDVDSGQFET